MRKFKAQSQECVCKKMELDLEELAIINWNKIAGNRVKWNGNTMNMQCEKELFSPNFNHTSSESVHMIS